MVAEFKLARFKYTWTGQWQANTVYNPDDVVSVNGKVYTCLVRHTSDNVFYTDLLYQNTDVPPVAVPKWELIADGATWRGDWTTSTEYFIGDVVKFGGVSYICVEGHFSTAQAENFKTDAITNSYWTVFLAGDEWKVNWSVNTLYKVGDIVKYSGKLYQCNASHVSSAVQDPGLLADESKWTEFVPGITWRGNWLTGTLYYKNDIVRYGGIVYRCEEQHQSSSTLNIGLEANQESWSVLNLGVEYLGTWTDNTKYKLNDVVKYGSYVYKCNVGHFVNSGVGFDSTKWDIFCPGQEYEAVWVGTKLYQPGDIVRHGGALFVSETTNVNSIPNWDQASTNVNWKLLFVGTKVRGEWSASSSYLIGDLVRRGGMLYSAKRNVTPGNDTDFIDDGSTINSDDWELVVPGVKWKGLWKDETEYTIGDSILWKGASYACIKKHISEFSLHPGNEGGVYWQQLTYSNPDNVLENVGDIKIFDQLKTSNVSIGTNNQTLRSTSSRPSWSNFNYSSKVYYVSLNGMDTPDRGTTLNAAWRTIRYALDRITGPATLFVKSGTYDEILPIVVPANVAVVGDELRGTVIQPAENYFTLADITAYRDLIDFIQTIIDNIITGSVAPRTNTARQSRVAPFGTQSEISLVSTNLNKIKDGMLSPPTGVVTSSNTISTSPNVIASITQIRNNLEFIQSESQAYISRTNPEYNYSVSMLNTVVEKILNGVIYDLTYSGDYGSIRTGAFFYNGSNAAFNKLQNMFLLNDATGIRNLTVKGLSGTLGSPNINLTRRPTAGAYASLNPGWGPNDTSAWIINRSPYVQNVTTFGEACVGLKIDGTLHNGGNKSIVANDFTQVLSDGIGVWCNSDGLTEVVSVFTYYNHISYLCTNGGKIRGTNGNSSYGTFGAVAEGFNLTEMPITASVNNRYYDATVGQVFTNGSNIEKLFFRNAGQNYTTASITTTGAGINASFLVDEFRDNAVYEARIVNLDGSTLPNGSGYTININNAQSGDPISLTLSGSVDETPDTFRTLRAVINSGTGAGQYGYVVDYDNTTKIALIGNELYQPTTVTSASSNLYTVATAINLQVNDAVAFTGTLFGNVVSNVAYYIKSVVGNQIELSESKGGPTFTLANGTGSMTLHRLGWNHFQPGTPILSVLDTTSSYWLEPRVIFSAPPSQVNTTDLPQTQKWTSIAYGNNIYVAVGHSIDAAYSLNDGIWGAAEIPNAKWEKVAYGNGRFIAVASTGQAAITTTGETWTSSTIPNATYSSIAYGNNTWVAVATGGKKAARSTNNGTSWTAVTLPEGADWSDIAYGKGIFVTVAQSDSSTSNIAYSTDNGQTWQLGSLPGGCRSITYGNDRFVAIAGGYSGANDCFISFNGITWIPGNMPSANWSDVTYGQGKFMAVATFDNFAAVSIDGVRWDQVDIINAYDYSAIAFSNSGNVGKFIAISDGSNKAVVYTSGTRAQGRAFLSSNRLSEILLWEPGSGYLTPPTVTLIDPNNSSDASLIPRIGNGVLGNPSIVNRGEGWVTTSTSVTITGDGFIDLYQVGRELIIDNATRVPRPGDNLTINGIEDYTYKVMNASIISGSLGNYRLRLTIAKSLGSNESPEHGTLVTIRQEYSQVRLTGHDFLDVGLGNFVQTNYPNTLFPNGTVLAPEDETKEYNGGRIFYTTVDQDGNFRVGDLFAVEQSTGTVTISAESFELQGLEELQLGGVSVGGTGVVIREFSTDPLFTADSNNIVPTQKAIKSYLARRVSGGGSDAFTTQFTAGTVRIGPQSITTSTLLRLEVPVKVKFNGGINGMMMAQAYFTNTNGTLD